MTELDSYTRKHNLLTKRTERTIVISLFVIGLFFIYLGSKIVISSDEASCFAKMCYFNAYADAITPTTNPLKN